MHFFTEKNKKICDKENCLVVFLYSLFVKQCAFLESLFLYSLFNKITKGFLAYRWFLCLFWFSGAWGQRNRKPSKH